jgi:hypothetical protein
MDVTESINSALDHVRAIYFGGGFFVAGIMLIAGTIALTVEDSIRSALTFYGIALVIIAIQVLLFLTRHIPSSQL